MGKVRGPCPLRHRALSLPACTSRGLSHTSPLPSRLSPSRASPSWAHANRVPSWEGCLLEMGPAARSGCPSNERWGSLGVRVS